MSLFRLGIFYMILLNIFSGFLSWNSSPSIYIILKFYLSMISQISWMFCVRFNIFFDQLFILSCLQHLRFSSISCFLSVMFVSVVPILSLSLCFLYCLYFNFPIFNCFLHALVHFSFFFPWFSWHSLRVLLISSNVFFVFSSTSLREFFIFLFIK